MSTRRSEQGEDEEPERKKLRGSNEPDSKVLVNLRSSDPDLRIIVKHSVVSEDQDGGEIQPQVEKEYLMYSQVLAKHSKFVDATLSNDMKEKDTMTITLHEVSPEVFEQALEYLQDPGISRYAKPCDVVQVVEFYDKYEFTAGLQFVDRVLEEYFKGEILSVTPSLDFFVETVCTAHKFNLKQSLAMGILLLDQMVEPTSTSSLDRFHPRMFREDHLAKLQPLFQMGSGLGLPHGVDRGLDLPRGMDLSNDEISSPLFPKYFVQCVELQDRRLIPQCLSLRFLTVDFQFNPRMYPTQDGVWRAPHESLEASVQLLGAGTFTVYFSKMPVDSEGNNVHSFILGDNNVHPTGDWAIAFEPSFTVARLPSRAVFFCPRSAHLAYPPLGPWFLVNENTFFAKQLGKPTLHHD